MKKNLLFLSLLGVSYFLTAQGVKFEEYDLANGLHVILHQDNAAPDDYLCSLSCGSKR